MKANQELAKVITLKLMLRNAESYIMVATANNAMTPERLKLQFCLPGPIIAAEVTPLMPLTFALDYSRRQREKYGLNKDNCKTYEANIKRIKKPSARFPRLLSVENDDTNLIIAY